MSHTTCSFHISNVTASPEKPFEIKVDSTVIFSSNENIEKKTVTHDIPVPKFASVHNVYINVLSPAQSIDELDRYNLSKNGTHFIIDPTIKNYAVKQCFDENGTTTDAGSSTGSTTLKSKTSSSGMLGVIGGSAKTSTPSKLKTTSTTSTPKTSISTPPKQTTASSTPKSSNIKVTPTSSTPVNSSNTVPAKGEVSFESVFEGSTNSECTLTFWVYGVEATVRYPFRILVDGLCVVRMEHNLEMGRVSVKIKEPRLAAEHKISLSLDMPLKTGVSNQRRIAQEKRYNLTFDGYFFLIDFRQVSQGENVTANVIQKRDDKSFGVQYEEPPVYDANNYEKRVDDDSSQSAPSVVPPFSMDSVVLDEYDVDASKLDSDQRERLLKVQSLQDKGILTQEEADLERKNIIGSKLLSFPKKKVQGDIKSPRVVVSQQPSSQQEEFVEMKLFLSNIKASPSAPFKLIYKPENATMITLTEEVGPEKMICVKGEIPLNSKGDTIAPIIIDMPQVGVKLDHSLNLTKGGRFAMIGVSNNETGKVICRQQNTEEFDSILEEGPKEEPTKIFVHFQGIPASAEQPFVVFINDKQAYKREEGLKKRQKGCINGEIPKSKRINAASEANHVVSVKTTIPIISPNPKIVAVDLTGKGPHVFITVKEEGGEIIIKQGQEEQSKEDELTICPDYDGSSTYAASPSTSSTDSAPPSSNETQKTAKRLTPEDINYLKQLLELKNSGILTEQEYEVKKNEVLF